MTRLLATACAAALAVGTAAAPSASAAPTVPTSSIPDDVNVVTEAAQIVVATGFPLPEALGDLRRCVDAGPENSSTSALGRYALAVGCLVSDPRLMAGVREQLRR